MYEELIRVQEYLRVLGGEVALNLIKLRGKKFTEEELEAPVSIISYYRLSNVFDVIAPVTSNIYDFLFKGLAIDIDVSDPVGRMFALALYDRIRSLVDCAGLQNSDFSFEYSKKDRHEDYPMFGILPPKSVPAPISSGNTTSTTSSFYSSTVTPRSSTGMPSKLGPASSYEYTASPISWFRSSTVTPRSSIGVPSTLAPASSSAYATSPTSSFYSTTVTPLNSIGMPPKLAPASSYGYTTSPTSSFYSTTATPLNLIGMPPKLAPASSYGYATSSFLTQPSSINMPPKSAPAPRGFGNRTNPTSPSYSSTATPSSIGFWAPQAASGSARASSSAEHTSERQVQYSNLPK